MIHRSKIGEADGHERKKVPNEDIAYCHRDAITYQTPTDATSFAMASGHRL